MTENKFTLYVETDNAAFDAENKNTETARILRLVADRLENGEPFNWNETLFDSNGNDVGRAVFNQEPF